MTALIVIVLKIILHNFMRRQSTDEDESGLLSPGMAIGVWFVGLVVYFIGLAHTKGAADTGAEAVWLPQSPWAQAVVIAGRTVFDALAMFAGNADIDVLANSSFGDRFIYLFFEPS